MKGPFDRLLEDLAAETADLVHAVADLSDRQWLKPSAAEGWARKDQISHLAYFDDRAIAAMVNPAAFVKDVEQLKGNLSNLTGYQVFADRTRSGASVLEWFVAVRTSLLKTAATLDARQRIPWYGPSMSVMSCLSARLMETWAHGLDIYDTLGWTPKATDRLYHVARLGFSTIGWSFAVHEATYAQEPIRVVLRSPSGATWEWGSSTAKDSICGPAIDYCMLVTQRRNLADLNLKVSGDVASRYAVVAQAFAGPPTLGRPPLGAEPSTSPR
jgi:uncharacterized protein (TIGR03084 family)